jgi:hypothetical protein
MEPRSSLASQLYKNSNGSLKLYTTHDGSGENFEYAITTCDSLDLKNYSTVCVRLTGTAQDTNYVYAYIPFFVYVGTPQKQVSITSSGRFETGSVIEVKAYKGYESGQLGFGVSNGFECKNVNIDIEEIWLEE